jgi:hypothetical protein
MVSSVCATLASAGKKVGAPVKAQQPAMRSCETIGRERQEAHISAAPAGMLERRALARRRNLRCPYDVQAWEG